MTHNTSTDGHWAELPSFAAGDIYAETDGAVTGASEQPCSLNA